MWLRRDNFILVVRDGWEIPIEGFGMFKFSSKLKHLKSVLKEWNRQVFGNIAVNIQQAEREVKRLETIFDASQLIDYQVHLNCAQAQLFKTLAEEAKF